MNPRRVTQRGPKRLKNLPPGLRRYWQRVRSIGRRVTNPRKQATSRINTRHRSSHMASRPRRRKRHTLTAHQRRSRAARKAARTRARRYPTGRSQRRRAVGADFGINPRRHHSRRLSNPRRIGGGSMTSGRGLKGLAVGAGVGAIGAVGLDYLWQYGSSYLPASLQTGYVGTAAKAGLAVLGGWGASKLVGKQAAVAGTLGALTVIAYQLVHQMIAQAAPTAAIAATTTTATPAVAGLGHMIAYMQRGPLGWVSPGTPLALRGLGNMRAYMQPAGAPPPMAAGRPGGTVSMSGLASPGSW